MREVLLFKSSMPPVHVELKKISDTGRTWSSALQLIYICEGAIQLEYGNSVKHLTAQQIALINPYQIHRLHSDGGVIATAGLDLKILKRSCPDIETPPLSEQYTTKNRTAISRLKRQLAQILKYASLNDNKNWLAWMANACSLYELLITVFGPKEQPSEEENNKIYRITNELIYAAQHFCEPLSPKNAAARSYLSVSYFSKLFHDTVGVTYSEYLEEIRLASAHQQLLTTKESIQDIALNNGFSSSRAFAASFKKAFGHLPRVYRQINHRQPDPVPANYIHSQYTSDLARYLDDMDEQPSFLARAIQVQELTVDCSADGKPFRHSWQKSIGIARARSLLYAEIQDILRDAQKNIGYQQAMIHGLFDDDMMVVNNEEKGKLYFSFSYIDIAFDFLLSVGLKPVVQLGYMPNAMAKNYKNVKYHGRSVISLPANMSDWERLVGSLVQHLQRRYGYEKVRSWEFCLWSKPDSSVNIFGFAEFEEYFDFYMATWKTIKQCDESIIFRSPAFMSKTAEGSLWLTQFFEACKINDCLPDIFSMDFYPVVEQNDTAYSVDSTVLTPNHMLDPDAMRNSVAAVHKTISRLGLNYGTISIEEWNNTISYRDPINDTAFKGSYIVKNALENWHHTDDMCYWSCSDMMEEDTLPNEVFHGGLGLYAISGIRKSGFYAMMLLSILGDRILFQNDNCIVTKTLNKYQVMLYNHIHYSALYATGELFDATVENSYAPFPRMDKRLIRIKLTGLINGSWIQADHVLDREHGSAYDQWLNMGNQNILGSADTEYLKGISQPLRRRRNRMVADNSLQIAAELEPFAVHLIELYPD